MDAGLAAFLGAIAGAAIAGVPPVVTAVVQHNTAKVQRQHEKTEEERRKHARAAADRAAKVQQIREWREGLAASHMEYQKWDAATSGRDVIPGHLAVEPNIASAVWFQSPRDHLSADGEANQFKKPNY